MKAKQSSPTQTVEHASPPALLSAAQAFNVRLLAYLTFAATLAAGLLTERFHLNWAPVVGLLIAFPILTQVVTTPLRRRYAEMNQWLLMLVDALIFGAGANEILISKTTHELVRQGISSRHKGDIRAKGFSAPVPVYEVVGLRRELGEQSLFTDVDLAGFSMQFDMERLKNYDKERILAALAKAHSYIKKSLH